jgi:hypothetical protein
VEAKGKQASNFDFFNFAAALAQVFPLSSTYYLNGIRLTGRGLCWRHAQRLLRAWTELGFRVTITVGVLLPEWSPDIIWDGTAARREAGYFSPSITVFRDFIEEREITPASTKPQRVFMEVLTELEANYGIRNLSRARTGLRFRLLTTQCAVAPIYFQLSGLETCEVALGFGTGGV